ncbi:zinc-binding alcohol dehydrogenase family protein [Bosea sp. 124]|nr:zinc-binding alcohol dehydrogenase family protein [Bosea sp. 124]
MQLARRQGAARIIVAASTPAKLAFARTIGADDLADYSQAGWADVVKSASDGRGPDVIYESVGGAITQDSLAMLAPGGQIAIYGALNIRGFQFGDDELKRVIFMNQSLTGFALAPLLTPDSLRRDLMELFALAADGELAVTIDSVFPLADALEAHRRLESRRSMGKVILVP